MNQKQVIGLRLRELRKQKKMSMNEVANHTIISMGTISKLENGIHLPKYRTLRSIAKCYHMSDEELFRHLGIPYTQSNGKTVSYRHVPVIPSFISRPDMALKNPTQFRLEIPEEIPKHCFMIKCYDDMDTNVKKGDLVMIDTDFKYQNGEYYAVQLNNNLLFGRIYKSKGHHYGVLVNNQGSFFNVDYKGHFKVLGEAVSFTSPLQNN